MHVFITADDSLGIGFNCRRQSRDEAVCKKITEIAAGNKVLMNSYSAKLFENDELISVSEDFLHNANVGDYCFAECTSIREHEYKIENLTVFYWNRRYPADKFIDIDLGMWDVVLTEEFAGKSHENITMKVYRRKNK